MKTTIVIPNYNGAALIKKNLPKVVDSIGKEEDVSVVIVDDGSESSDFDTLLNFLDSFKSPVPISFLKHKKNLGFSSAVNTGAFHKNSDVYIFLNSDVAPEKGFVEKAIKHFKESPNLFGVGFLDKSIEGEKVVLRGRGIGRWRRGMLNHSRGEIDKNNTLWVSGGSSAIRGELFRKLGGFDTLYNPFYWEDIDLSYRAQKMGYDVMFDKDIKVEHRHEEGAIKKHYKKNKINSVAFRNQFIFHWKNITDITLMLNHFFWLPYYLGKAVISGDGPLLKGFGAALIRLPQIISKKGRLKVSDSVVINQDW